MTTPLSKSQLERLRRDAKRRAREKSIRVWEAQRELATEHGYGNWSLLVKASEAFQSVSQILNRRAFATLFMRRYEALPLAAIATQLGHLRENAMDDYWHVARHPGAKVFSERNGTQSPEAVSTVGEVHNLAAQSMASCPKLKSSTARVLDDVARTLGHPHFCITTAYLNALRHRANRGS